MGIEDIPVRVQPYVEMTAPDEAVALLPGPLRLTAPEEAVVDSGLSYRWTPSSDIVFEGPSSLRKVDMEQQWMMAVEGASAEVPALITGAMLGSSVVVRGSLNGPLDIGAGPVELMRFSLIDFPSVDAAPILSTYRRSKTEHPPRVNGPVTNLERQAAQGRKGCSRCTSGRRYASSIGKASPRRPSPGGWA